MVEKEDMNEPDRFLLSLLTRAQQAYSYSTPHFSNMKCASIIKETSHLQKLIVECTDVSRCSCKPRHALQLT